MSAVTVMALAIFALIGLYALALFLNTPPTMRSLNTEDDDS